MDLNGTMETVDAEARRVKVDRRCPRCGHHAYHWGNVQGIKHRIGCVRCGHEWSGRIRKDEMDHG